MIDKTEEDKKRLRFAKKRGIEILKEYGFNLAVYSEAQLDTLIEAIVDGSDEADSAIDEVPW